MLLVEDNKPKSVIRDFSCKKSDYSRLFHRYSIYILTQYASFILFQDKMKAKFSNDRFGFMDASAEKVHVAVAFHLMRRLGESKYLESPLSKLYL